jgi:outer membrane protein
MMGYHSSDNATLAGMQDRRYSYDMGLKAGYELPWQELSLTARALTDTLRRHQGSSFSLALGRDLKFRYYRFSPSLGLRYDTAPLLKYYYGVRQQEARVDRPAYEPHGAFIPHAGLALTTGISKQLIVILSFGAEALPSQVRKSPIVNKDYGLNAAAGLAWRF